MKKIRLGKLFTKKRLKILIPFLVLLVIVLIVVSVVKNMSAPAEGSVSETPPSKAEIKDPYADPGKYSGKYISFNYPAHYKKLPSKISGSYLEVFELSSTNFTSKHVSVGVLKGDLTSDSSIMHRKQHTELYKQLPVTRYGVSFSSTTNGSEQTAYNAHNGMVAAISITTPGTADLTDDVQFILTSLQWK